MPEEVVVNPHSDLIVDVTCSILSHAADWYGRGPVLGPALRCMLSVADWQQYIYISMGHIVVCNIKMELCRWMLLCLISCLYAGVDSQNVTSQPITLKLYSQEMAGLQALWEAWKDNTPDPATNLRNWGSTSDPCGNNITLGWKGVHCINTTQWDATVFFLHLNNTQIVGVIPPEISLFTNLEVLSLPQNNLTGQVPNVSNLTNLWFLDISNNHFNGSFTELYFQDMFYNIPYLNISKNLFDGEIPPFALENDENQSSIIGVLDLSNNKFTGPLPSFTTLINLTFLDLSSNFFTGLSNNLSALTIVLPTTLSKLSLAKNNITGTMNISTFIDIDIASRNISRSLKVLSLKDNMITNVVTPQNFISAGQTRILLQGNPYCNNIWSSEDESRWCAIYCEQPCIYLPKSNNSWKAIVMECSISFGVILMFVIFGFIFGLHRNQKHIRHLQKEIKNADINTKWFEYNELRVATKNFALEMKLGAGAYGAVYKGVLENNNVVAIKQLFLETNKGKDGFFNEILLISNLQHRNLVTLKGYCIHGKQTLLVYEYVDNCDLEKLLFGRYNCSTNSSSNYNDQMLSWQTRLNVCQGVAQGLYYLHASSQSRIIHRDIKASNILLDKNFSPKIADFGLARPIEDAKSVILTQQCAGTLGYLAPEYMCNGMLSEKADVFSFGVLLLEIVSAKRNRDLTMPEDEVYLPTRAWKLHKENKLLDMKDASLLVTDDEVGEVQRVLETAVLCVQSAPEKRPSMFLVATMLAGNANVDVSHVDKSHSWPESFVHG